MNLDPELAPIYVRVYSRTKKKAKERWKANAPKWANFALVLDCETTTDIRQDLTFLWWRFCELKNDAYICQLEGVAYNAHLGKEDVALIRQFARKRADVEDGCPEEIQIGSRTEFANKVLWEAIRVGAAIVCFNSPFDLSRVSLKSRPAKLKNTGWSVTPWPDDPDPFEPKPWIRIKPKDSRSAFMSLVGGDSSMRTNYSGRFLDLSVLGWALRNKHKDLNGFLESFHLKPKVDHEPTGLVTKAELKYGRTDTERTVELLNAMKHEYDGFPLELHPEEAMSAASITKAFLDEMRITPPAKKFKLSRRVLGKCMQAYYGGRSEIRIRHQEIEIEVSNRDTLRRQWEEVMETCLKDQSGQLPGKTIVFAMTKAHAHRIAEVFEEMYPQHVGVVQVITSTTERVRDGSYGDGLITKFKKNNLPRIAISVDMLDTGIDVPEVVNLVFMKPVQSRIKLWQMIGRGTRNQETCKYLDRLPDGKKTEFKIIDFWQNDFNKKATSQPPADIPVLVSLFNTRLKIIERHLPDHSSEAFRQAVTDIRAMMARVPQDSFPVKKVWLQVSQAWEDDFWTLLTPTKLDFLRLHVAPLLRFAADVDVAAETFTHKVERLKLQILQAAPSPQLLLSIAEDVSLLPDIAERVRSSPSAALALSSDLAAATPAQLTQIIRDLAPQMKNRRDRQSAFLKTDLPDFIATHGYISVGDGGHQILIEEYKRRVDARVLEIVEKHPALTALREGREVTDDQLVDLERTLHRELGRDDIQLSSRNMRIAYGLRVDNFLAFLRHLLALDTIPDYPQVVQRGFERHIQAHNYNAEQIRFLRSVQEVFLAKRTLVEADLYDPPLTNFGRNAVERFFTPQEIGDLLNLTQSLAA